jgi:16S rRNA processing protein RimM
LTEPEYLTVGRVLRPHGVRGELLVEVLTDFPESLPGKTVTLTAEADSPGERLVVDSVRWHRGRLLVRVAGRDDRESVEALRNYLIQIDLSQAEPLAEGQYYHHQIVGLRAVADDGRLLGRVSAILETGANDVYVVETPEGGELLVPAIRDAVRKIDLEAGEIVIHVLDGLRP